MGLFFVLVLLIGGLAEWLSLRRPLEQLGYRCRPDRGCHEPGETFVLETVIENHSRRAFRGLRMEERFPAALSLPPGTAGVRPEEGAAVRVQSTVDVRGRQRLVRRRSVSAAKRGRYVFSGVRFLCGDYLGLWMKQRDVGGWSELVIYPRREESAGLELRLDGFYGDYSVRRFLVEDPVLIRGFHDYTGAEPMRAISWTQSARHGRLTVKEYDYTQDRSVTVVLDARGARFGQPDIGRLEAAYRVARTVFEYLEERDVPYRFFHNMVCGGGREGEWQFTQPGSHLEEALEALGRASYFSAETLSRLAERALQAGGQAFVAITPERAPETEQAVRRLRAGGALVCVLYAEDYEREEEKR